MNFESNEEQRLLTDSVRRFIDKDYDFEKRRKIIASPEGWDSNAWAALAEMGVTALALPAEYDGFDGGAVDLMGIMEAFGAGLVVEPFLPTVLAGRLVMAAGSEAQRRAILPRVASGELRLAFAHLERGARFDLSRVGAEAKRTGDAWTISGEKRAVVGAPVAGKLVVSARTPSGLGLFLIDTQDAELKRHATVDGMRVADVLLFNAKAELLGDGAATLAKIEEVNDFGTALVCAEAVGAMKYACDTTLDYLKTRKQFGVTIGSFQALQHRMVDMYIASELSRSMTCLACSKVDATGDAKERAHAVSAAKIKISDSARLISQEAVQLHGGMGMTEELKVSHTFRRLTVIAEQFGDEDYHLTRFGAL
ncbi:acyl-CoA dehydrogenase [Aromatoleum toluolicum]|uniref:Pimeloyl-CoA dehydrogenase small subunit n=1 Tax=Aromatoleum toluolicum TaxID=90060 RepID=A0ABX1NHP9_9RHOO|nr:acyl-CoA dehydrogenase [Aromatoleum toluolicum]NMF98836.1 acyl-CoA dehydrogenase [Aromatoleum toluolicum]